MTFTRLSKTSSVIETNHQTVSTTILGDSWAEEQAFIESVIRPMEDGK
jgi:hypothetical protein